MGISETFDKLMDKVVGAEVKPAENAYNDIYMPSLKRVCDDIDNATYTAHANTGRIDIEKLGFHLKELVAELNLSEKLDTTVMKGTFKKHSGNFVNVNGEAAVHIKSSLAVVINHKNWPDEKVYTDIKSVIPEALWRVSFDDGNTNIASMLENEEAMFKDRMRNVGAPTIPDNLYDIKSGQPLQTEDVPHGEKPAARSIVPVQA